LAWTFLPNTVFRAGYGVFFAPGSGGIGAAPSDLGSGSQSTTPVFLGPPPAAPNTPPPGGSFGNPFATGLLPFPSPQVGSGISAIFRDWRTPMNMMWNANIQRNVTANLLVEVAYVGSRGMRIWNNFPMNAAHPQFLSLGNSLLDLVDNPFYGKITSGNLSTPQIRRNQLLVPYPHYGGINWIRGTVGDSVYHGFTLRAERAFAQGLLFQGSYTSAKLIDNVNERFVGGANFINPFDLNSARSVSPNDISQRFVGNFVYELPLGRGHRYLSKGIGGFILGNWQASGIITFQTGTPIAVTATCSTQLSGIGCYADRNGVGALPEDKRTLDKYFNTAAYTNPLPFSLGTGSRTEPNLRNPGQIAFDSVLSRWQPIREGMRLQLRFEMYNMLNHPNLGSPAASVTATNFGQITSKNGNRTMQAALRLEF
jgi:hypothetical protein